MDRTPISQHLAHLNKGLFDDEATEELAKLVKAVRETGKKGELTIKLAVKMIDQSAEDTVLITPTVAAKLPSPEPRRNVFYSTHDGDLLRNDPNQGELNLKEVPKRPAQQPKSIEG